MLDGASAGFSGNIVVMVVNLEAVGHLISVLQLGQGLQHYANATQLPAWCPYVPAEIYGTKFRKSVVCAWVVGQLAMAIIALVTIYNNLGVEKKEAVDTYFSTAGQVGAEVTNAVGAAHEMKNISYNMRHLSDLCFYLGMAQGYVFQIIFPLLVLLRVVQQICAWIIRFIVNLVTAPSRALLQGERAISTSATLARSATTKFARTAGSSLRHGQEFLHLSERERKQA